MRPVEKLNVGDSINLYNAQSHTITATYNPYASAKDPLTANISEYCSYCESPVSEEGIHIEHVQPKSLYPQLEHSWTNFLLSCARCNGADNKSNKDVNLAAIHLPHQNNTMMSIEYGRGGIVRVHSNLAVGSVAYQKATALIDLVGLHKRPGHPNLKAKDRRWLKRNQAWELAVRYESKFRSGITDIDTVVDLAKANGFFSVWFSVFENHPTVKQALIQNFRGTSTACFDSTSDFVPIPRNTPNI